MSPTVHVSGISPATSEKEIHDFFSFCGKIVSLSVTPASGEEKALQSATVTFEKDAAANTALLLDQTQLGGSPVSVEAASTIDQLAGHSVQNVEEVEDKGQEHHIAPEDKPRSRILAEYLAHGYGISDTAIAKAIELDAKHGISDRFTSALKNFDTKYNATGRAKGLDEKHQITAKATSGWHGLGQYFEKALAHPSGQKIREFYTASSKQILDVHNEARRLADLKQGKTETSAESAAVHSQPGAEHETASAAAPSQPEAAASPAAAAPVDHKA